MPAIPLRQGLVKLGFALFFTYMSVALALPVVSVFVIQELKLANWLGGLAVGISFLSTIFSRKYAGTLADTQSSKKTTMAGILLYMAAAAVCGLSALAGLPPALAFSLLIAGRLILGIGESLTMVGLVSWSFSLLGPQNSGRILSVVGMAMYGSFAVGGPVGIGLYNRFGFFGVMLLSFVLPLVGYALLGRMPEVAPLEKRPGPATSFTRILGSIWQQGAVVCLQGVGFAVLGAFITLYFNSRHWPYAGLGLTFFGGGFVCSRILFGGLPDRIGGIPVASVSLVVETLGQCLLWFANDYHMGLVGALFTGLGCSMIFPSMGVEVIKRVAPELRATAFGGFAAFQDVAYAFSAPIAGIIADWSGYSSVFMFGSVCAAMGTVLVFSMGIKARQQLQTGQ